MSVALSPAVPGQPGGERAEENGPVFSDDIFTDPDILYIQTAAKSTVTLK